MDKTDDKYLLPTSIIDSDHEPITRFAQKTAANGINDPVDIAVRLYYHD